MGWAAAPELGNVRRSLRCATFITDLARLSLNCREKGEGARGGGKFWSAPQDICPLVTRHCEYTCLCVSPTAEHSVRLPAGHPGAEQLALRCPWYLYGPSSRWEQDGVSAAGVGRVGIGLVTGGGMGETGKGEGGWGDSVPMFCSCAIGGFLFASVCS